MDRIKLVLAAGFALSLIGNALLLRHVGASEREVADLRRMAHADVEVRATFCRALLSEARSGTNELGLFAYADLVDARDAPDLATCTDRVITHQKLMNARREVLETELEALIALVPGNDVEGCCAEHDKKLQRVRGETLGRIQKVESQPPAP